MKKTKASKRRGRVSEDLRPEYHFDYAKARRNRFATKARRGPLVVVLDDDIARVFKTPEAVKAVLRAIVATMPPRRTRASGRRIAER